MGKNKNSKQKIGEFDLIAKYFAPLATDCAGALSLLDDGAVLDIPDDESIVVTTDCLVEGVHFLPTISPGHVATRALGVNLSDLAAMGAAPRWIFLSLQLSQKQDEQWVSDFSHSLGKMMGSFGVFLAGGDTVSTPGPLAITITAIGSIKKGTALKRSGANVGDEVWVSGTIGDADIGLELLKKNKTDIKSNDIESINFLINRHLCPEPRVELGKILNQNNLATACIDISDGMLADLGHICSASNVSAIINIDNIPLSDAAKKLFAYDISNVRKKSIGGGDDYELLFCVKPENSGKISSLNNIIPVCKIGTICKASNDKHSPVRVLAHDGKDVSIEHRGWDHLK